MPADDSKSLDDDSSFRLSDCYYLVGSLSVSSYFIFSSKTSSVLGSGMNSIYVT